MQPLAVDAALLRAVLTPEFELTAGREMMARVAAIGADGRGQLSLAGELLDAELPANVSTGDELRLLVREITPEKVVLQIQQGSTAPFPQSPVTAAPVAPPLVEAPLIPMPAGGSLQVTERDAHPNQPSGDGTHVVSLRYDAPNLGLVDMTFTLGSGTMKLAVTVPAGTSHDAAQASASELSDALAAATERPASVTVTPRREPIEVFA